MLSQIYIYVKGDVTGVGFRAWTKIQAKLLGVTGWVRNVYEKPEVFGTGGGVEAVLQGEEDKVSELLTLIKKGPSISRVDDVDIFFQEPKELYEVFEIRK